MIAGSPPRPVGVPAAHSAPSEAQPTLNLVLMVCKPSRSPHRSNRLLWSGFGLRSALSMIALGTLISLPLPVAAYSRRCTTATTKSGFW
jgi:hypothetical protein